MWCATIVQSNYLQRTLAAEPILCKLTAPVPSVAIYLYVWFAHNNHLGKYSCFAMHTHNHDRNECLWHTDEDCTKATECVQTIAIDMQINTYNTFIPSHLTLASSEWLQLCWPMALLLQFSREDSVPLHTTLSKRIAPFPLP